MNLRLEWTLFLDDERDPTWYLNRELLLIARDCEEAKLLVQSYGIPSEISFDHDLGKNADGTLKPDAKYFLLWLIELHLEGQADLDHIRKVYVHSMNPVGAHNIAELWDNFASHILDSTVRAEIKPRN